jgi:SAM-dependent methyltransferase
MPRGGLTLVESSYYGFVVTDEMKLSEQAALGLSLAPGREHYRAFVGYPGKYDVVAAMQFNLLTFLGLREQHRLLDVGCGSLRAGRLLIPYLLPDRYYGIEPEQWLVEEGLRHETGHELIQLKRAKLAYRSDFKLTCFGVDFDFILAQSIFSHAGSGDVRLCLKEAAACLRPEGLLVASFVLDKKNYTGSEWVYPTCVGYTESGFKQMAAEAGLACQLIDWPHPNAQSWAVLWQSEKRAGPLDPTYLYAKPCVSGLDLEFIDEDANAGFFDGLWDVGESWLAYGWAVARSAGCPADFVLFTDSSKNLISTARVEVERPDVAQAYGANFFRSGFQARLSKSVLQGERELHCYSFLEGSNKAYRLSGAFETK